MDKRKRMDVESLSGEDKQTGVVLEREDVSSAMKKAKKVHLSYLKNTEWMFSNQHFEEPLEHMPNYF